MAELERIERASGRHYVADSGREYPSVTNILSVIAKPALIPWAAKVERELCIDTANRVFASLNGSNISPQQFSKRLELALPKTKAHRMVAGDAANIGNEAHSFIEWRILGELGLERGDEPETSEPARWAVAAFEDWRREVKLVPTHSEKRLFSDELDAAGSADVICCELDIPALSVEETKRVAALGDWKTSKALWPEHDIQTAAYRHMAIERGLLDESSFGLVLRLPKSLADPGFEARLLPPSACVEYVEVFKAARRIWEWKHKGAK